MNYLFNFYYIIAINQYRIVKYLNKFIKIFIHLLTLNIVPITSKTDNFIILFENIIYQVKGNFEKFKFILSRGTMIF